jgi:hypothetical protein
MATWQEFEQQAPELAALVRERFAAGRHCTLATIRSDGAPRISGSEVELTETDVFIGSMAGSVKARDLLRDSRFALHSPPSDPVEGAPPQEWPGEAKLAGSAVEVPPGPMGGHRFRLELTEVVLTRIAPGGRQLEITSWHPARGVEVRLRD